MTKVSIPVNCEILLDILIEVILDGLLRSTGLGLVADVVCECVSE